MMASMVPMKKIHDARRMILEGKSVSAIAKQLLISASTVTRYTKSERAKMKSN